MRKKLAVIAYGFAALAQAETPEQIRDRYLEQARHDQPSLQASAQRGAAFFQQSRTHSPDFPACTTCHTSQPLHAGRHQITGKTIKPLAPAANPERFTDPARVEKWFGRNCREVVGRDCSAAEKADLVAYLAGVR